MRVLALNLGNSSLLAGLFDDRRLIAEFRVPTSDAITAAGFSKHIKPRLKGPIDRIALCSVVPSQTADLAARLQRAFRVKPRILTAAAQKCLRVGYREPRKLGTDRLAAAIGAHTLYPDSNVIVIDCGTAATLTAVSTEGLLAGGAIIPGLALWSDALATRTAQLPRVTARRPLHALGRSPVEAISSGLYHGHLGALSALTWEISREAFGQHAPFIVVGTGGGASLFCREELFTHIEPSLVLQGLLTFALA